MGTPVLDDERGDANDPRPRTVRRDGQTLLAGWRCTSCSLPRAARAWRCPDCGGELADAEFGPAGTVWSSTVVHLDISGIAAPYALAYVDLDDGPRFLAHIAGATAPVRVGTRVTVTGTDDRGDVHVQPAPSEVPA